ncbi:MAG: RNA methyltransferase [Paramuribaculum sp.]|nr:RNA methyltransferase [Paramuribaculum sp.]MDE6323673.1 RNA methyltransferase [Paramuribaculum sp.]
MDLTNTIRKNVASLSERKFRKRFGMFKCEGRKCVADTLGHFQLHWLFATPEWISDNAGFAMRFESNLVVVNHKDIERMSSLMTPQDVIAVYHIPEFEFSPQEAADELVIALDNIRDPGNLGTIVRTADWFGIKTVLCSEGCADLYNPKVVQATMGAISRVRVIYCDLPAVIASLDDSLPVYGTFLDGESLYSVELTANGLIVMGNEGSGVSDEVAALVSRRLFIPPFPGNAMTSESLNVATATAVTVAEFRRRMI